MRISSTASTVLLATAITILAHAAAFAEAFPAAKDAAEAALVTWDAAFIKNAGQWLAPEIRYALDSHGVNVGLTDQGPRFQIFARPASSPGSQVKPRPRSQVELLSLPMFF